MWHYAENNEPQGPVDESVIAELIRAGRISPETSVWRNGMSDWRPASATELNRYFAAPAPAAAPPSSGGDFEKAAATPTPQYAPGGDSHGQAPFPKPANWYVAAIVAVILGVLCCSLVSLATSIPGLIFAIQVDKKWAQGDWYGAANSAKTAKILVIISYVLVAIGFVLGFIVGFAGAFAN